MSGRPEETQRQLILAKQREREAVREGADLVMPLMQPSGFIG